MDDVHKLPESWVQKFFYGCMFVYDLTQDGGTQWLATIPRKAREAVTYSNVDENKADWLPCSVPTRIVFSSACNDGITECSRNWLPDGGHCLLPGGINTSDDCSDISTQVQHGGLTGS